MIFKTSQTVGPHEGSPRRGKKDWFWVDAVAVRGDGKERSGMERVSQGWLEGSARL